MRRRRWVRSWLTGLGGRPAARARDARRSARRAPSDARAAADAPGPAVDVDEALLRGGPGAADPEARHVEILDGDGGAGADACAAYARLATRPVALEVAGEDGEEERDLYVRTRARSPRDDGPGWLATAWRRTAVVRRARADERLRLSDGAAVVAVANPRSLVDVHVCDAETDGVVAEAILTLFELDASIERDACARAVDGLGALVYGDEAAAPAPGARAPRRRSRTRTARSRRSSTSSPRASAPRTAATARGRGASSPSTRPSSARRGPRCSSRTASSCAACPSRSRS